MPSLLRRLLLFLAVTGLAPAAYCAQARSSAPTVLWYTSDFPPVSIRHGKYKGRGWADLRIARIVEATPEFQHKRVEATAIRLREDQLRKDNVCSANLLRTPEREKYLAYSDVALRVLPNGLITTPRSLPRLERFIDGTGQIALDAALASQQISISVAPQRSFGEGIDAALQRYAATPAVISFASSNHTQSRLLKLLRQQSIDALIAYEAELNFLVQALGLRESDFIFIPIREAGGLSASHVACPKSDLGLRVIAEVNKVLSDSAASLEDRAVYEQWLSPASVQRYHRLLAEPIR